jgi:hypothetical protein
MAAPHDTPDNASRVSIDSNSRDGFNRIRIPTNLKSQIYAQIADSSESLPYDYDDSSDDDGDFKVAPKGAAQSKLSNSLLSSDIPTPTPERPNPLEQVPTARDENRAEDEPSPVRSHERGPTHTKPLASRVGNLISDEDSGEERDMSRQTTVTSKNSGEGKRPKLGGRPSTMRRIGSAIKKTMSNNKHD